MHNINEKYYFIKELDTNIFNIPPKDTIIIYRNYSKKNFELKKLLFFKEFLKKKKIKLLLSNNIRLALKFDFDGAYIPSFNKDIRHLNYSFKKNFILIGSAHNLKQIKEKEKQKVNRIFISSLFKKNENYLGINKFKILTNLTDKKVIALGGISKENLKKINLINCFGFAGITFFSKKKAP